jgi:hypothetical protein
MYCAGGMARAAVRAVLCGVGVGVGVCACPKPAGTHNKARVSKHFVAAWPNRARGCIAISNWNYCLNLTQSSLDLVWISYKATDEGERRFCHSVAVKDKRSHPSYIEKREQKTWEETESCDPQNHTKQLFFEVV